MHQKNQNKNETGQQEIAVQHIPVLADAVLHYLDPKPGDSYLDVTAGYGGHAELVVGRTLQPDLTTLVDRDRNAIDVLTSVFKGTNAEVIHSDFLQASEDLVSQGRSYNLILADIGVSSPHLNIASRGFSISEDGPLDMRMDQRQELTASDVVNSYSQMELESLIRRYGEEPKAKRIASLILANRPIESTSQLAMVVSKAWPGHSKVHPATRTFQAIRIAVNGELEQLQRALVSWRDLLAPGGRLVVISFHSLEDRIVKQFFADNSTGFDGHFRVLTPKPVVADNSEIVFNPRARSAKLRAAVKINT